MANAFTDTPYQTNQSVATGNNDAFTGNPYQGGSITTNDLTSQSSVVIPDKTVTPPPPITPTPNLLQGEEWSGQNKNADLMKQYGAGNYTIDASGNVLPKATTSATTPTSQTATTTPTTTPATTTTGVSISENDPYKILKDFLGVSTNLGTNSGTAAAYNTVYANSGQDQANVAVTADQQLQVQAQQELSTINAQITDITNQASAAKLKGPGGSGEATTAFGNANNVEIDREAAIKTLPLQAQALVAQAKVAAAQGNTVIAQNAAKMAQDKFDKAFAYQAQDMKDTYTFNQNLAKTVYDYATAQQKSQLDAQTAADTRGYNDLKTDQAYAGELGKLAIATGRPDLATKLLQLNPNDSDYMLQVADVAGEIPPPPKTGVTINMGDKIGEAVQIQNALDAQTSNSAWQRVQAVIPKQIDQLTTDDINALSNSTVAALGTYVARMDKPDIARAGGDVGNAFEDPSWLGKLGHVYQQGVKGRTYDAQLVIDSLKRAQQLQTVNNTTLSQYGLGSTTNNTTNTSSIPKGTDGSAYGYPGFVSDGTQWVEK